MNQVLVLLAAEARRIRRDGLVAFGAMLVGQGAFAFFLPASSFASTRVVELASKQNGFACTFKTVRSCCYSTTRVLANDEAGKKKANEACAGVPMAPKATSPSRRIRRTSAASDASTWFTRSRSSRNGTRDNAVMSAIADPLTEKEIRGSWRRIFPKRQGSCHQTLAAVSRAINHHVGRSHLPSWGYNTLGIKK